LEGRISIPHKAPTHTDAEVLFLHFKINHEKTVSNDVQLTIIHHLEHMLSMPPEHTPTKKKKRNRVTNLVDGNTTLIFLNISKLFYKKANFFL
jgi:hypothetical protein